MANVDIDLGKYSLGWSDPEKNVFKPEKGLNEDIIRKMSEIKEEPEWMLDFRLKAYKRFLDKPMPEWVAKEKLDSLDFDDIYYYIKPTEEQADSWDMVPDEIKETYEKLGIPEAERSYLAGVTAQYESEVVYHRNREDLEKLGVIFCDMDTAVREYPELVQEYFGTIIPPGDNKFAALNSAVWSGGSFIYVPKGVHIEDPLQAYFRINAENMGQFERTLIIVDEGPAMARHIVPRALRRPARQTLALRGHRLYTRRPPYSRLIRARAHRLSGTSRSLCAHRVALCLVGSSRSRHRTTWRVGRV